MVSFEFLMTSLVVVLIPGTGVIYTISTGLFNGAKSSIFAALGCTVGIVPHLLACVLGLAAIAHFSALVFQLLKYIGVAYLLLMAWFMWKETGALTVKNETGEATLWEVSLKGFLINILNPKLSLFFLAFLPQFLPENVSSPMSAMLILSCVFMGITFGIFVLYGLLANSVSTHIVNSPQVTKYAQRTFAAAFALLGLKLAMVER